MVQDTAAEVHGVLVFATTAPGMFTTCGYNATGTFSVPVPPTLTALARPPRHAGESSDAHPLMSRMHKPDPKLGADQQDKRSVIAIELADVDVWLFGTVDDARSLVRVPPVEVFEAGPL